jgi:catechol 2,3-dioxygenase-like lactoylglutathione lyase family enzyme
MNILGFDHIVLCVRDVEVSLDFYERILGMTRYAERRGKWSLHFGSNKISLQDAAKIPAIARNTSPGSGNFCLLTDTPIAKVVEHLRLNDIEIVEGPAEKAGRLAKFSPSIAGTPIRILSRSAIVSLSGVTSEVGGQIEGEWTLPLRQD